MVVKIADKVDTRRAEACAERRRVRVARVLRAHQRCPSVEREEPYGDGRITGGDGTVGEHGLRTPDQREQRAERSGESEGRMHSREWEGEGRKGTAETVVRCCVSVETEGKVGEA